MDVLASRRKYSIVLLAYLSVAALAINKGKAEEDGATDRIDGGVPAGTSIPPGELGCFMTRMRMITTTKLGKRRRNPNGIEMDEFPFNLMRLRKKDNRDSVLDFSFFHSVAGGIEDAAGSRL